MLLPGHMSMPSAPLSVYLWGGKPENCPGERLAFMRNLTCEPGIRVDKPQCTVCQDEFHKKANCQCECCIYTVRSTVFLLAKGAFFEIILFVITTSIYISSKRPKTYQSITLALTLRFAQAFGQLASLPITWPAGNEQTKQFFNIFSYEGAARAFGVHWECFMSGHFTLKLLREFFAPLQVLLYLIVLRGIWKLRRKSFSIHQALSTIAGIWSGMLISIASITMKLFIGMPMPYGKQDGKVNP